MKFPKIVIFIIMLVSSISFSLEITSNNNQAVEETKDMKILDDILLKRPKLMLVLDQKLVNKLPNDHPAFTVVDNDIILFLRQYSFRNITNYEYATRYVDYAYRYVYIYNEQKRLESEEIYFHRILLKTTSYDLQGNIVKSELADATRYLFSIDDMVRLMEKEYGLDLMVGMPSRISDFSIERELYSVSLYNRRPMYFNTATGKREQDPDIKFYESSNQ